MSTAPAAQVQERARASRGGSESAIYSMVARSLERKHCNGSVLDVGCGTGSLWRYLKDRFSRYAGVDAVRYDGLPEAIEFVQADVDQHPLPLSADSFDVVVAVETIEHLENPRAFVRELVRLAKPGGWIVVTTPNQLSILSLVTLILKGRFNAFQDVHYPAHLTALLEIDLLRIARECGLEAIETTFSESGRIIGLSLHYPRFLARLFPRRLSDNILLIGRKTQGVSEPSS